MDWTFTARQPPTSTSIAQTLAKTSFAMKVGEADLKGEITGEKLIDAPALTGRFAAGRSSRRANVMQQFGIAAAQYAR